MVDIKCGEFKPLGWRHPKGGIAIWSAPLTPVPGGSWRVVFNAELVPEGAVGNYPGTNLRIEGGVIEFDSQENAAKAAATVIRRVVEKANTKMAALEGERREQSEAAKKQRDEAGEDLRRLKEKYKDGI